MNFDEWLETKILTSSEEFECAQAFEAGQQSKQDNIDDLQKQIIDQQKAFDNLHDSYEAVVDELVTYRSRFGGIK